MRKYKSIVGNTYNNWTVLERAITSNQNQKYEYLSRCACGVERWVVGSNMVSGVSLSCGCLDTEPQIARRGNKFYNPNLCDIYYAMLSRCNNTINKSYVNYGARGITVSSEWVTGGQDLFISDMGERPEGGMLDRINNNLGYSKENCVWATRTAQNRNRRNNLVFEIDGETKFFHEWLTQYKISERRKEIYQWMRRSSGRTLKDALIHFGVITNG